MPSPDRRFGTAVRQASPRQGSELSLGRASGKTLEALSTGPCGELGKKYANDTFYGSNHIQIHAFPSPRVD
jgi:hypothetical protein